MLQVMMGCQAAPATQKLVIWEGPSMLYGRMSASLGSVKLKSGKIVAIGGSPSEYPFAPHTGTKAIEIVDPQCVMSAECRKMGSACKCWFESGINVPYGIGGNAFLLPDGRIIAFSSVYVFNPDSHYTKPEPETKNEPTSGPISAVIIDIEKKSVTPIYRPKNNKAGQPALAGNGPALLQRAFERSLQLKDGRIVRVGGHVIYSEPWSVAECREQRCFYCKQGKCTEPELPVGCKVASDCPEKKANSRFTVLDDIEIYTPPDATHPLGSVQYLKMSEARSSVGAIELKDGRVLITGGWGPKGDGPNENYLHTYYLLLNGEKPSLRLGPRMLVYREDHAMAMMKDGRVLITGGTDQNAITVGSSEIFDPAKGLFYPAATMNLTREDHFPIAFGPWLLFFGGEVNDKADQIRNTVELYSESDASYIGPVFLFSRPTTGEDKGFAGVTDFAIQHLDENTLMLFGGQQGLQDRDGEFISGGKGSKRTLILRYQP
jgi:hypothetical protein